METKTKDEYIAFRLSRNLKKKVKTVAENKDLNISRYVRRIIKEKLNN